MLAELNSKGGCLCKHATEGKIRCPLIVRPTSEDVVTGNLFGVLQAIDPRWWLPGLLNCALQDPMLGRKRFRQQFYRQFTVSLWQKQAAYPACLIPWEEGITEVDVVIEFENPATTIFIEMKYGSPLSSTTAKNAGDHGFPSDQLIRNIRIGLRRCNWFDENLLVSKAKRDFLVIVLAPFSVPKLVDSYQNPSSIRDAIPNGAQLSKLPDHRFVGGTTYSKLMFELESNVPFMATSEKRLVQQLREYLDFKQSSIAKRQSALSREVTGTFLPVISV
jgi:hypothetical protein